MTNYFNSNYFIECSPIMLFKIDGGMNFILLLRLRFLKRCAQFDIKINNMNSILGDRLSCLLYQESVIVMNENLEMYFENWFLFFLASI